jgi:hypothetical protein
MIKEIQFGTAIKLGKTLELSWHNVRGNRWDVTLNGDIFTFKDTKGEFATTHTTKANVKFWVDAMDEGSGLTEMFEAVKPSKKGKAND